MSGRLNDPKFKVLDMPLNNNAKDVSGYGNDGTWFGTEAYAEDAFGGTTGDFDRASDLTIANPTSFDFGTSTDFSLFTWIKTSLAAVSKLIIRQGTDPRWYLGIKSGAGTQNILAFVDDGSTLVTATSTSVVNDDEWHLVGATFTRTGDIQIYIDGEPNGAAEDMSSVGTLDNNNPLIIGAGPGHAEDFQGQLGKTKIYKIALTRDEVKALYNQGQRNPKQVKVDQPIDTLPNLSD